MRVTLRVTDATGTSYDWTGEGPLISIGRDPDSDLSLEGGERPVVSWVHARIEEADGQPVVRDLNSKNGTYVNGTPVESSLSLAVGDTLQLGKAGPKLIVVQLEVEPNPRPVTASSPSPSPAPVAPPPVDQGNREPRDGLRPIVLGAITACLMTLVAVSSLIWISAHRPKADAVVAPVLPPPIKAPEPPKPEPPTFDELAWSKADFVLYTGQQHALGVRALSEGNCSFAVVGKAEGDEVQRVLQMSWQAGIPVIDQRKDLVQQFFNESRVGSMVPLKLNDELSAVWHEHRYVPTETTLVVFEDLRSQRLRIGFRLQTTNEGFFFQDLSRTTSELARESLIRPGSLRTIDDDEDLCHSADYLDYCVYHIRRTLSCGAGQRRYRMLMVNPVRTLGVEPRLAQDVDAELRRRLSAFGVPFLEREASPVRESTRAEAPERGVWQRTSFDEAAQRRLLGGTHLLEAWLYPSSGAALYELAVRLVAAGTGEPLWSSRGQRRLQAPVKSGEIAFLLQTGRLAAVRFQPGTCVLDLAAFQTLEGGFPLRLPPLSPIAGRGADAKTSTTLGYVDQEPGAEKRQVLLRDLFDKRVQPMDPSAIADVAYVASLAQVPSLHELRYLVWRLASAVLPAGGRVIGVEGDVAQVNLGRRHGLRVDQRLEVLQENAAGSGGEVTYRKRPFQLIVTEVGDQTARAAVAAESPVAPNRGDVVHRVLERNPTVAVLTFLPEHWDLEPETRPSPIVKSLVGEVWENKQGITEYVAKQFGRFLEGALVQLDIEVLERNHENLNEVKAELDRQGDQAFFEPERAARLRQLLGASHIILGRLSPGLNPRDDKAPSDLRVLDVESGRVVEQIQFVFTRQQFESWRP